MGSGSVSLFEQRYTLSIYTSVFETQTLIKGQNFVSVLAQAEALRVRQEFKNRREWKANCLSHFRSQVTKVNCFRIAGKYYISYVNLSLFIKLYYIGFCFNRIKSSSIEPVVNEIYTATISF